MKVVILGVNGYVGRHLANLYSKKKGADVLGADIQLSSSHPDIDYRQIDVRSPDYLKDIPQDFDVLYFLSGLTGTLGSFDKYEDFIRTNELGLLHLLTWCKSHSVRGKIVFPSTRLVYKGRPRQLAETAEKEFRTIYAINKFASEQYLAMFGRLFGLRFLILRVCVPYGSMLGDETSYGTINRFLALARTGQPITLYGNGNQKRSLIHISDLTEVMVKAAHSKKTDGLTLNLGGPDSLSIRAIATKIARLFEGKVTFQRWPHEDLLVESGDTVFDSRKIHRLIPHRYSYTFDRWIREHQDRRSR